MRKEPNKKMIGLFLLIGLALFAIITFHFFQNKFADNKNQVVMFFEESITGLNVGAPIVFKGVQIGQVTGIGIVTDLQTLEFNIPVTAKMNRQGIDSMEDYGNKSALLEELIKKGLRARLTTQSFVTGQLMIELEMLPNTPIVLKNKNPDLIEIPTALSQLGEFSKGLQDLPIRHSVESFNLFFDNLNKEMPKINKIVSRVDKLVTQNSQTSVDTINNFNDAMINIGEAAKSFRNLADYLERHPEALLKGKGGY